MTEEILPINLEQRRTEMQGPIPADEFPQPQNILPFPGVKNAVEEERNRLRNPVPSDRLNVLDTMVWDLNIGGGDLISGLNPDKKGRPLTGGPALFTLQGAVRALESRDEAGVLTEGEKQVADHLRAFRFINGFEKPAAFNGYMYRRIFGREMPNAVKSKKPQTPVLPEAEVELGGLFEDVPQEEKIPVHLPEIEDPSSKNRVDRLLDSYQQILDLYIDSIWPKSSMTWEEKVDKAKMRQRIKKVLDRIERKLGDELIYDENELNLRKEQLRELTELDETVGFSPESMEFLQRKLVEYRSPAVKERGIRRFEKLTNDRREVPIRVTVNRGRREAVVGDKVVEFDKEGKGMWDVFLLLTTRGKQVLPKDILGVAQKEGITAQRAIHVVNELRLLIGDNPANAQIVVMRGTGLDAKYSFEKFVDYFVERPVEMQAEEPVRVRPEMPEAVHGKFKLATKDRNYRINLMAVAMEVLSAKDLPPIATLDQVQSTFGALSIRRIQQMQDRKIINPKMGFDQHPVFNRVEQGKMGYILWRERKGSSISQKEAKEIDKLLDPMFDDPEKLRNEFKEMLKSDEFKALLESGKTTSLYSSLIPPNQQR